MNERSSGDPAGDGTSNKALARVDIPGHGASYAMRNAIRSTPQNVAPTYLVLSATWILVSDWFVGQIAHNEVEAIRLETIKGIGFVVVSTALVFWLAQGIARTARLTHAEDQLTRNTLDKLLASLDDAVFIVDPATRSIVAANPAVERVFGYPPADLVGKTTDVLHADHSAFEEFGTKGEPLLDRESVFRTRYRMKRRDGTIFHTANTVATLHEDLGWQGGVISIVRDITDEVQYEERLIQHQNQLEALSRRLLTSQEEERRRISREIHDELGQNLTAIRLAVDALVRSLPEHEREQAAAQREVIDTRLKTMLASIRRVAHELRPSALDNLGLGAAITTAARDFERSTGIPVDVSTVEEPAAASGVCTIAAYRILQESLTNVARHAKASHVDVRLRARTDELILEVRDDGMGVSPGRIDASLGILSMRERAEQCGGRFEIMGMDGRGTIVRAILPARDPKEGA